jgi:hypothetical protein
MKKGRGTESGPIQHHDRCYLCKARLGFKTSKPGAAKMKSLNLPV